MSPQLRPCMKLAAISLPCWSALLLILRFIDMQIPRMNPIIHELHIEHPLRGYLSQQPHVFGWSCHLLCQLTESHGKCCFLIEISFLRISRTVQKISRLPLCASHLHKSLFHGLNKLPSVDNCVGNIFFLMEYLFLNRKLKINRTYTAYCSKFLYIFLKNALNYLVMR